MHLHTIAAFAFLFWRMEAPADGYFFKNPWGTALLVMGLPAGVTLLGLLFARKCGQIFQHSQGSATRLHHRSQAILRIVLIAGYGAIVFLTPWCDWIALRGVAHELQILSDLLALFPYFLGAVGLWVVAMPVERMFHGNIDAADGVEGSWRMSSYLDFHVRHHLLVIAGPMILILFAANLTHGYEGPIREWSGSFWTPDILLGAWAAVVFLFAPFLLRRLWRTDPLEPGPLRDRLAELCTRIGLRCRDILVWKSDGLMINAAVMGVLPFARYVLLSDALLATMTPRQIEAVFGHEAGHVRHRHMQHFLVFALVGWLIAGAATEGFSWWLNRNGRMTSESVLLIQGIAITFTFVFWLIGFGWLSRRFERQADLFGARCVAPAAAQCQLPCSVHRPDTPESGTDRVCATGAATFASALDRVATMSGISADEPSWRHASVGERIRFLYSAAGDPSRAIGFERLIRRVKLCMLVTALLGSLGAVYYWTEIRPVPLQTRGLRLLQDHVVAEPR